MKLSEVPRPAGSKIGKLIAAGRDPLTALTRWARDYGDHVFIDVLGMPTLILNHPDDAWEVMVRDQKSYQKDQYTRMLREFLGLGLLTNEGDAWKRQRRLAQPAFHHGAIAGYAATMTDYAERTADSWGDRADVDVHASMMHLTLEIVATTLFGHDIGDDAEVIARGLDVYTEVYRGLFGTGIRVPLWVPLPVHLKAQRVTAELDAVIYRMIAAHREKPDPNTLLGMLLSAVDEDGSTMTDQQLRDESITLMMAGHETTANALTMTFYLLSQHPAVEERLHAELDSVLGHRAPGLGDLKDLPYTRAVVMESMRLYPPAWAVGREAIVDTKIGDIEVPTGTQIWIAQWVLQRDGRWFVDPLSFRPERWLDGTLEKSLPKGAYIPFGAGPRVCIGKRFAQMEAELITATIARRVSLRLSPGETLKLTPSVTLRPESGLRMTATARPSFAADKAA